MKSIIIRQHGGPEQLVLAEAPKPAPGPKQALVRIEYCGVNFIDIYFRTGLYKAEPPFTPGFEASGTVEAVGEGVTEVAVGDRVAYSTSRAATPYGSYAEYAVLPAWQLVKVPDHAGMDLAAAVMLQGLTAHYLSHSTWPLQPGETALVHAAAGGVGLLLVQMAKMRGARVIGTVGNQEKAKLAREAGADEVILYNDQDFEAETKRLTGGRGVDVVYDSVGASTFMKSLNSLRPRGLMASFGQSSGAVPPVDISILNAKGSLFLTRPSLGFYMATREELLWRAGEMLGWIEQGKLKVRVDKVYPLADAAEAHRDLEGRKTSGKLLIRVA